MGFFWHKNCKWKMTNRKTLLHAKKRLREQKEKGEHEQKQNEEEILGTAIGEKRKT